MLQSASATLNSTTSVLAIPIKINTPFAANLQADFRLFLRLVTRISIDIGALGLSYTSGVRYRFRLKDDFVRETSNNQTRLPAVDIFNVQRPDEGAAALTTTATQATNSNIFRGVTVNLVNPVVFEMFIRYNPGNFASLFVDDFALAVDPISTFSGQATLSVSTAMPSIPNGRLRLNQSTISSAFILPDLADGWRTKLFDSDISTESSTSTDGDKFKGTFCFMQSEFSQSTQARRFRDNLSTQTATSTVLANVRFKGSLKTANRPWTAITTSSDGTIYAADGNGQIWTKPTNSETFNLYHSLGQSVKGIAISEYDDSIWITSNTVIFRANSGTTNFQTTNSPDNSDWRHITTHPDGTVYATNGGVTGDRSLYKLRLGQTVWNKSTTPLRNYWGITTYSNKVYASVSGGDTYVTNHNADSSSFNTISTLNLDTKSFTGIDIRDDGQVIYAATSTVGSVEPGDGYIWELLDTTQVPSNAYSLIAPAGTFPNNTLRNWTDITVSPTGEIFACEYDGQIYCVGFTDE